VIKHPLTAFEKAPPDARKKKKKGKAPKAEEFVTKINTNPITGHLQDLSVLDQYGVSPRIRMIIEHGKVPGEDKEGDNSRSVWQMEASCALVRHKVPDQLHYNLLMNPNFRWHETVHDHGGSAYAVKQVRSAKETVANDVGRTQDDVVERLNKEGCCVVNLKGKVRYVYMTPDTEHPTQLVDNFATKDDFLNWFADDVVDGVKVVRGVPLPVKVPVGNIYVDHPERRKLSGIKFFPGKPRILPNNVLNTCSGFAVRPKEGDCSLFLNHCRDIICNKDPVLYKYLLGWMAGIVQKPWDLQRATALILTSPNKGTGKSKFGDVFGSLFGRHYMAISDKSHLTGKFNAHTSELVLMLADEMYDLNDPEALGVLNTRITEKTKPIEKKGIDTFSAPNYCRYIILSNDDSPVKIQFGDRRFVIFRVSETRIKDFTYFAALDEQMDNGGREALLHFLLHHDISNFNAGDIPHSEQKDRLILRNAPAFEQVLISWAREARLPGALVGRYSKKTGKPLPDRPNIVASTPLYEALRKSGGKHLKDESDVALSYKLEDYGFKWHGLGDGAGKKAPDLQALQAQLEKRYTALVGTWRFQDWGAAPVAEEELGLEGGNMEIEHPF
jgi:hypothetical protein